MECLGDLQPAPGSGSVSAAPGSSSPSSSSDISVLDDGPWCWPNAVCTPVPRRPLSGGSGMRAQARDLAAREAGHQPVAPRPGHRSPPDTDQSDRAGQARHHHRHRTAPVKGARGRRPVLDQHPDRLRPGGRARPARRRPGQGHRPGPEQNSATCGLTDAPAPAELAFAQFSMGASITTTTCSHLCT